MTQLLLLSIRFLDDRYHGQTAQGERAEWPPSPFRLFQALVAGNARGTGLPEDVRRALCWLETLAPPAIFAPLAVEGGERLTFVINNYSDKKLKSRAPKTLRPMLLKGDQLVQYAWTFEAGGDEVDANAARIVEAVRHIRCLGWGIDMAIGAGCVVGEMPVPNESRTAFRPGGESGLGIELRSPTTGSLLSLERTYADYVRRYEDPETTRMEATSLYQPVVYCNNSSRPYAAFQILKPDLSGNRSFDTPRRVRDVAAWLRHAVGQVCDGWPFESQDPVEAFVHGHDGQSKPIKGQRAERRFMFLPLPSIERRGERGNYVGAIRRVLLVAPPGCERQLDYARKRLAGFELVDMEGELRGVLNLLPKSDWVLRQYTQPATSWSTVTPVVLPGHDDRDPDKAAELIARAFRQAGFAPELLRATQIDFRKVGFLPGVDHADRYELPEQPKVKGPRYHVQVRFPHALPGPIAIGALRYRGFGLMVGQGELESVK